MCVFIQSEYVMPGYICCACKSYHGLQRSCTVNGDYRTLCQFYDDKHNIDAGNCPLVIPDDVVQCAHCLAGYEKNADGTPRLPIGNAAGRVFNRTDCPICSRPFQPFVNRNAEQLT